MVKIFITFINISLVILLLSLVSWFEKKDIEIQDVNRKHMSDIRKLKNIPAINKSINKYVRPALKVWPKSDEKADLKLIRFFDKHALEYDFIVNKYLYHDSIAHYLEIEYSIPRSNKKALYDFLQTKFHGGFIQFLNFNVKDKKLEGTLQVIQPFTGDNNAS